MSGLNGKIGQEVDQGIDPALGLEEFIENNHFPLLQDAITALKCTPLIPKDITQFFDEFFDTG
jgi:hypothetical protein